MKACLIVFVLTCLLATGSVAQANLSLIWAEWETSAPAKQGPEHADGLLLYFHGRGGTWGDQPKAPILPILEEMAKVANWDVLRINRHALADTERSDDDILRFVAERVAGAREDGYKKIVVAADRAVAGSPCWQQPCLASMRRLALLRERPTAGRS
jgi:hypothetical protein